MMTYERNDYVKSQTADLSRQIDLVLDQRHEADQDLSELTPKDPKPVSFVRTLMNGLSSHK